MLTLKFNLYQIKSTLLDIHQTILSGQEQYVHTRMLITLIFVDIVVEHSTGHK